MGVDTQIGQSGYWSGSTVPTSVQTFNDPALPWNLVGPLNPAPAPTYGDKPPLAAGATDAQVDEYIRNYYGYMGAFLGIPEVAAVLREAARNNWDEYRLFGAVSATSWWRTTSATQREWLVEKSQDPAEAARKTAVSAAGVADTASTLGISIPYSLAQTIAEQALANGWDERIILDHIVAQARYVAGAQAGDIGAQMTGLKGAARSYGVTLTDKTAWDWAIKIAKQEASPEGVAEVMRRQAKARYSYIADLIDAGVTVEDYFSPLVQDIAAELEMNPDDVDFMDPRWSGMMEVRDPNGQVRGATRTEAQLAARRTPEFTKTQRAQAMMGNVASWLMEGMGH